MQTKMDYFLERAEKFCFTKIIKKTNQFGKNTFVTENGKIFSSLADLVKHHRDFMKSHALIDLYDQLIDPATFAKPNPIFDSYFGTRIW